LGMFFFPLNLSASLLSFIFPSLGAWGYLPYMSSLSWWLTNVNSGLNLFSEFLLRNYQWTCPSGCLSVTSNLICSSLSFSSHTPQNSDSQLFFPYYFLLSLVKSPIPVARLEILAVS
jgi:hypothetical protein